LQDAARHQSRMVLGKRRMIDTLSDMPAYFALKRTTDAPGQDTLLEFVAVVNGEG
jgi:hypothetical protein